MTIAVLRLAGVKAASHRTAAHIHGLWGRPSRIEVVTNATGVRDTPVIVHQCLDLTEAEIVERNGIRVTDVARTIIDIGVPAGIKATQIVLDGALRREMTTLREVAGRIHRYGKKGRRGIGPARRLVVELDSEKYHTDPESFRADRRRQNELVGSGLVILRFTWWDVMAAPDYVVATVSQALRMTGVA